MIPKRHLQTERFHKLSKLIIDAIGYPFFSKKTVLDLGGMEGDIGASLYRLGSSVCIVEARAEFLRTCAKKFPGIQTKQVDLDREFNFHHQDIILDLGLICHLKNWENHLRNVLNNCNILVLETAVCDSSDDNLVLSQPDNKDQDASFNGFGSFPTAAFIEKIFKECHFEFKRYDYAKLSVGSMVYDWQCRETRSCSLNNRRVWIARRAKEAVKQAPLPLVDNIPQKIVQDKVINPVPPVFAPLPISKPAITISSLLPPPPPSQPDPPSPKSNEGSKIAVVIPGHLRLYEKTYKSFWTRLMQDKKADVFISTWGTYEGYCKCPSCRGNKEHLPSASIESRLEEIKRIYKPLSLKIHPYSIRQEIEKYIADINLSRDDFNGFFRGNLVEFFMMLWQWNECRKMVEGEENKRGEQYEIIIRMRPDLLFETIPDYPTMNISENNINLPNIASYYDKTGVNDQMMIAGNKAGKTYLSFYDKCADYLRNKSVQLPRPETLLKHHLIASGLSIKEIHLKYYLLRTSGEILYPCGIGMCHSNRQDMIRHLL
jgi:hypothetical protein